MSHQTVDPVAKSLIKQFSPHSNVDVEAALRALSNYGTCHLMPEKFGHDCNGKSGEFRPLLHLQLVKQLQIHIQQFHRVAAANADVIFDQ